MEKSDNPFAMSRRKFLQVAAISTGVLLLSGDQVVRESIRGADGVPDINLDFFYEYHSNSKNKLERFRPLFNEADIFVTEYGPWDKKDLDWFRNHEPKKDIDSTWDVVFGSGKPVFFIDPPKDHPLWSKFKDVEKNMSPDYSLDYDSSVGKMGEYLRIEVGIHKERESIWEDQLLKIIKEVKSSPQFSGQNSINILIEAGAYHTSIYHRLLKSNNPNIKGHRKFSEDPITFPKREEIMRRLLFKAQEPSKDDIEKVVLEAMLNSVYGTILDKKYVESPTKKTQHLRGVIDKIDANDTKKIFDQISLIKTEKGLPEEENAKITSWLTSFLGERGINII
jgi:hypothetical protein